MSLASIIRSEEKLLVPTYDRHKVLFERGRGVYLWDSRGKKYLDFLSGIGVNALGHNHPAIQAALKRQAGRSDSRLQPFFSRVSIGTGQTSGKDLRTRSCFLLE